MTFKKLFSVLLISFMTGSVMAIENNKPQWSEFYPEANYNLEYIPTDKEYIRSTANMPYCRSEKKWVKVVNTVTVIPALDCWGGGVLKGEMIKRQNQEISYWKAKQTSFDNSVKTCDGLSKADQASCYMQVRQLITQQKQNDLMAQQNVLMKKSLDAQNMNTLNQSIMGVNQSQQLQNINNSLRWMGR